MLDVLVVAPSLPAPDRQAGMLRFLRMLEILGTRYKLHFLVCRIMQQIENYGMGAVSAYEARLLDLGVSVHYGERHAESATMGRLLHRKKFDIVFFEDYQFATPYLDEVRFVQPQARTVIDTIDLGFERLLSKARDSRREEDFRKAMNEKAAELSAYRRSDAVIAICDKDKETLLREDDSLCVEVIPLVFPLPELRPARDGTACDLLFVGNFEHTANVEAIVLFCVSIFPAIRAQIPHARLTIVGNAPPQSVVDLADEHVNVMGFVPDINPYYENSDISIAPLTWGGGLKGKVAEAMSHGLPVVGTAVAIEGFGLRPGEDVVLADTPAEFANGVVKLHRDRELYERIRTNGWKFVQANYTGTPIKERIHAAFDRVERCAVRRLPLAKQLRRQIPHLMDRHLLWRFHRGR